MKRNKERAASLVEFSLLVALIAVVTIGATRAVASKVSQNLDNVTACVGGIDGCGAPASQGGD